MECDVGARVIISRLEFKQLAIQYGVWNEKTCNIRITHSDFESAKITKRGDNIFESITLNLSRKDFSYSGKSKSVLKSESIERYNFRKRALENTVCPKPKRSRNRSVVRTDAKVPKLITASRDILVEGDVVLAKMRTYAAWPAVIKSFRKTCVNVEFFGDGTTGNVQYGDIGLLHCNRQLIIFNLQKKINGYRKSVSCAEGTLQIPAHLSVLNNV